MHIEKYTFLRRPSAVANVKNQGGNSPSKNITLCDGIFVVVNNSYSNELIYLLLIPYYVNYLQWQKHSSQITT